MNRKPNLIVFLTDQQRADTLACYGNQSVRAPNLNKLASESVVFERAYVTQPLCVPSRASLFTGMWPHANGCTRNGVSLDWRHRTFAELLENEDYYPAYMGKWQLGNEAQQQRGFREWITTEGISNYSEFLTSQGYSPDSSDQTFSDAFVSELAWEVSKPRFLQDKACEFIRKHSRDPFVLFVSYVEPHSPYNGPFNNEHPISEIELDRTALLPASDNIPRRYRLMREWQQTEAVLDRARLPRLFYFGVTPEEYREIRQRYFGLITTVDRSVGAILSCLEDSGLLDDTILVYTSDHGDSLGAHHLFAKEVMFEEATRVPYFIRMPGQRQSSRISQPISQIDFLPTMMDLLGQPKPQQCAGKSRVPLCRGEIMPAENVFMEWSPNRTKLVKGTSLARRRAIKRAIDESTRAIIRPDGWKLCLRDKDLNELYHLTNDPFEAENIYARREHDAIVAAATEEIRRWQQETRDKLHL